MKKRNNNTTKSIIIISFIGLYLFCMMFATYIKKEECDRDFYLEGKITLTEIKSELEDKDFILDANGKLTQNGINYMQYVINEQVSYSGKHRMIGIGILDSKGKIIADTSDNIIIDVRMDKNDPTKDVYNAIKLEEYFTNTELEEIISYLHDSAHYSISYYYDYEIDELILFYIREHEIKTVNRVIQNNQISDTGIDVSKEVVFEWKNEDYLKNHKNELEFYSTGINYVYLPKLRYSKEHWEEWEKNEFLHDYQEGISNEQIEYMFLDHYTNQNRFFSDIQDSNIAALDFRGMPVHDYKDFLFGSSEFGDVYKDSYRIQINMITNPWLEAVDELKDVYLFNAFFVVLCMIIVLYITERNYKRQVQLEEIRRDFTNAIAHELKTPLSIVRGLAENIDIEDSEDMRAHFTRSIVGQTEVMNQLVEDMLFISKMDSDKTDLKKENLNLLPIIEEQMNKLEYPIEGKNLQIQYWKEEDFIITGDKSYIEKAVFNLLENAVTYNRMDGKILIHLEKDNCIIENTGDSIPEEDLPHVCDMFFTGNKSRNSEGKHKGLGLYLAKRILDMYEITLKIENSDVGVRVLLHKK